MLWALLSTLAFAGDLYVNGTKVDPAALAGTSMRRVSVDFRANGDVFVDAPGYTVEVLDKPGGVAQKAPPPPPAPGVPVGLWWLVTEDNGSRGHTVEVRINGRLVHTQRSGDKQTILDVAPFVRLGENRVVVSSNSMAAQGGTMYAYIGRGGVESGTVMLKKPSVQYALSEAREGAYKREYTLNITK